jgi:superfamily II DNA or RNA helicase
VVPPGGGKTLIGLEAARRLGRPTVVLCPNTAIQAQWMAQWQAAFGPDAVAATASRELPTPLTVLTYQALCTRIVKWLPAIVEAPGKAACAAAALTISSEAPA